MKILDIQPTKGHVLVQPFEKPNEVGGLIIAGDSQNSAPVRGTVLRVPKEGSQFKVAEELFFRRYAIDELKFIGEKGNEEIVYLIDEREILGVVRPQTEVPEVDVSMIRKLSKGADKAIRKAIKN